MFDVVPDHDLRMLRLKLRGFWDDGTMVRYLNAIRGAMADLQRTGGCKSILIDMSDFPIQSKAVAEGHARQLHYVRDRGGIRVAFVMQSALSKLQAARVASDTGNSTFDTEQAALDWLLADGA